MKKILYVADFILLIALFVSCANETTATTASTAEETEATWAYSSSSPVYKVGSSVTSLTITGLTADTSNVYLVKLNTGSTAINASNSGYISAMTGVSSSTSSSASASLSARTLTSADAAVADAALESGTLVSSAKTGASTVHFIPPQKLNPYDVAEDLTGSRIISNGSGSSASSRSALSSSSSLSASANTAATTTENKVYSVGNTKEIYVDQDSNISTFSQESATLRAKGTHCYVWVVDAYYGSTAGGDIVNTAIAESYAALFDEIYPMITNVFGYESDTLLEYTASGQSASISTVDMSDYDTGTMVNIVIYDIANDYTSTSGSSTGIVGYFYCKDYYTSSTSLSSNSGYSVINYSNKGKYFYVDSYYANAYLETTYSTLAHEFQHMINFGMKDITKGVSPSTWYNEMLSMLCEDMMQFQLGISDDDSPKERLATFNEYNYISGVTEYLTTSTSYELVSYSTAYAFGAWLCRWYGGANLVNAIMSNDSVDGTSIAAAVSKVTGTTMTFTQILEAYVKALVFQNLTLAQPTFNQAASDGSYYTALSYTDDSGTYYYPMAAINLWDTAYEWTSSSSSSSSSSVSTGPALFACTASGRKIVRPTGFTLHTVGTSSSDTVTLTISEPSSSTEELFIFIE